MNIVVLKLSFPLIVDFTAIVISNFLKIFFNTISCIPIDQKVFEDCAHILLFNNKLIVCNFVWI